MVRKQARYVLPFLDRSGEITFQFEAFGVILEDEEIVWFPGENFLVKGVGARIKFGEASELVQLLAKFAAGFQIRGLVCVNRIREAGENIFSGQITVPQSEAQFGF